MLTINFIYAFGLSLKNILMLQSFFIFFWALIYQVFFNTPTDLTGKLFYNNSWSSFIENLYFSTLTFFGVGYGGIRPLSIPCKIISIINIFITGIVFAYSISKIPSDENIYANVNKHRKNI